MFSDAVILFPFFSSAGISLINIAYFPKIYHSLKCKDSAFSDASVVLFIHRLVSGAVIISDCIAANDECG
jgi:hypothetical protein